MNEQDDYTPLQSLLVVQALTACKPTAAVFDDLAQRLGQSTFFASTSASDSSAYTPDSLKNLYLHLAKKEARREINGFRITPRRKSPTPKSQKQDGEPHAGRRAAELVPHLYEEYRAHVIREIKEEERKYDSLTGELKALKHAEGDKSSTADGNGRSTLRSSAESLEKRPAEDVASEQASSQGHGARQQPSSSIDSVMNHAGPPDTKSRSSPLSAQAAQTDRHADAAGHLSKHSPGPQQLQSLQQVPSPNAAAHQTPILPSQSPSGSGGSLSQTSLQPATRLNGDIPDDKRTLPSSHSADPGRPAILSQDGRPPNEPASQQLYNETWKAQQQASQAPPHGQYFPQNQSFSGHSGQQASPNPSTAHGQQQVQSQQRGGIMLPPFQISPHPLVPSDGQTPSRQPASAQKRASESSLSQQQRGYTGTPYRRLDAAATPTPLTGPLASHLVRPGVAMSPGSSTAWKLLPGAPSLGENAATLKRSVSPISEPEDSASTAKPAKPKRGRPSKKALQLPRKPIKQGSVRTDSPSGRSQSTSSQVEDRFRHPSALGKTEVPDTPGSGDDTLTPTTATRPRRGGRRHWSKRRLSTTETNPSVDEEGPHSPLLTEHHHPAPATIVATRNLFKVAKTLLEQISSHKHASLFAEPVTNKKADGYEDYIKVRQDLKSIRAAIKNGEKVVAAATASEASPGGNMTSSSVILPISDGLIPPKSIVNAGQLEAELYRMFANAVLFNAGEGDYVVAAREMFRDTEHIVQAWRSSEGADDSASAGGQGDEEVGPSSKRRRV